MCGRVRLFRLIVEHRRVSSGCEVVPTCNGIKAIGIEIRNGDEVVERGNGRCMLASTATARRFYLANGYVETGRPAGQFGTQSGFPMSKSLK